jgi:UDP-N-acetylglucosamine--N-acetylmuramyl-(pentapeptide) pyrophosphoryl-undecaprenol N-acetylglucosamine transferase
MITVTGGGTGGHIFPAVAVVEELQKMGVSEICWIGDSGGREREWAKALGVDYFGIRTGKLRRYFSLRTVTDGLSVLVGILQSGRILKRLEPAVLFSKGGFVSVPPALAARRLHIPVVTHESDLHPGLATRIIARSARAICVSFEKSADFFEGKRVEVTGNPVRKQIQSADRDRGLRFLHFEERLPVVAVLGGSLGASSLNGAVRDMRGTGPLRFNLVHQCGRGNGSQGFGDDGRYRCFEFIEEEMGDILAASDLIVSRAGAGALFEIACLGKPSILVPLPRSKSRGEQIANARYFQEHGASRMIEDDELGGGVLASTISELLGDDEGLQAMGLRARGLCTKDGARRIVDVLLEVAEQGR